MEEWTVRQLNKDVVTLILIAWERGISNAKVGVVDRADPCGFDMRTVGPSGAAVTLRIDYAKPPCKTAKQVKDEILALRETASRPRLPFGPLLILTAVMWILLASAWLHKHDVHVLEQRFAKVIGLHKEDVPPSKTFLAYATLAILGTNLLEAIAVFFVTRHRLSFSSKRSLQWFFLTLLAGYPVAHKIVDLKQSQAQAAVRSYRKKAH